MSSGTSGSNSSWFDWMVSFFSGWTSACSVLTGSSWLWTKFSSGVCWLAQKLPPCMIWWVLTPVPLLELWIEGKLTSITILFGTVKHGLMLMHVYIWRPTRTAILTWDERTFSPWQQSPSSPRSASSTSECSCLLLCRWMRYTIEMKAGVELRWPSIQNLQGKSRDKQINEWQMKSLKSLPV